MPSASRSSPARRDVAPAATTGEPPPPWMPDLGDGTYRNPILHADYSDPDVVRVGDDFWMTASNFSHVPGLPILHSRDLVNWSLVNHALPRLVPEDHFARPRHGAGVWAPAIRHHDGRFWIYYPDPDFGIYVVTADDPRDRWSEPHLVLGGKGLIDPCPLWDDDGRCHLAYAWAHSRSGRNNVITLQELTPDGRAPAGEARDIIDGETLPGWHTLEGPKVHKRDGWYWIFAPAGGVGTGFQAVFRSRRIEGPYEARIVLAQGATPVNGPHQGAWVDTPAGEHWFLHFQEMPAYGRVVHLQPMRWREDGWPEIGAAIDGNGCGQPVPRHAKPRLPSRPATAPAVSDDFSSPYLEYGWQWQANPRDGWARPDPAARSLHLRCVPLERPDSHWTAGHLLMRKFPAPRFSAEVALRLAARHDGERAGLIVFGCDYAWLGLRRVAGRLQTVLIVNIRAHEGGVERVLAMPDRPAALSPEAPIHLRVQVAEGAVCTFSLSWDGTIYMPAGPAFQARSSRWVGAKVGLFASTTNRGVAPGNATFHDFSVGA